MAMKKGISAWAFGKENSVEQIFALSREAGFDGVELTVNGEDGEITPDSTEKDILRIANLARDMGVGLYSLATDLFWKYSLTSGDDTNRETAKFIVRRQLEIARLLGCDTVLVLPGAVHAPGLSVVPYDTAYERALEALSELREDAAAARVSIGLENVWNNFLLSPLEFRGLLDQVGSPWVGAYFDVGNVVYTGYPEHWIKILGKRIKKVHLKDYRRSAGNLSGFVDLLSGDVDFIAVMKALEEAGYDDWLTAEVLPPYKCFADQLLFNTSSAMDRILGRMRLHL